MKKLILLFFFAVYSYAITPYSLENLKELNIKFINKKDVIPKVLEEKITKEVKDKLESLGIKTTSDKYAYLKMTVKITNFDKIKFVRTSLVLQEDVKLHRDETFEAMAVTYQKNDEFELEDLEVDIYESFIKYLLDDFIEQYKSEN